MEYNFYGLRRSGNHAVLEWLLKNISKNKNRNVVKKDRVIQYDNSAYINECNTYHTHEELNIDILFCRKAFENLVLTYEDVPTTYKLVSGSDKNIVIVRNINNLFASRRKKGQEYGHSYDFGPMHIDEKAVNIWKQHINVGLNGEATLIHFEKWVANKEYRDSICRSLNIVNLDNTNTVTSFGGGSSFSGKKKPTIKELKSRSEQIDLPKQVQARLEQPDIIELQHKLNNL